jgi:hypothetical protein
MSALGSNKAVIILWILLSTGTASRQAEISRAGLQNASKSDKASPPVVLINIIYSNTP